MDFREMASAVAMLKNIKNVLDDQLIEQYVKDTWNAAYSQGVKDAAKVAENIFGTQFHDKTEIRTGRKIARNIRAIEPPSEK